MEPKESFIHPTALIEPGAVLGRGVWIGPYCLIGPHVVLGDEVILQGHVVLAGRTRIGAQTKIFPFASLGHAPQDLKYRGEATELLIGPRNTIREYVTMNPGTAGGGGRTVIGANGLFMVGVHIGHDCQIGDHVIFANNTTLAGHVEVEDHVVMGGLSGAHQFVRIGAHAMIGGMTGVEFDVIPFGSVIGNRGRLAGLNLIGLKRHGIPRDQIHVLRSVYKKVFVQKGAESLQARLAALSPEEKAAPLVQRLLTFLHARSRRGFVIPESLDLGHSQFLSEGEGERAPER